MHTDFNKNMGGKQIFKMSNANICYYDLDSNYMCEYTSYDKIRLVVVFSGLINYTFADKSIDQTNTAMFLLPQYTRCNLHVVKRAKMMVIEIEDTLIKSVYQHVENTYSFNDAVNHPQAYVHIKYTSLLYGNVQKIHSEFIENKENPYLVELNICRLLYNLLKTKYAGYLFSIRAKHPMEQIKFYIDRNIKDMIKINDLADLVGMTGPNLTNTFKRHFGVAPTAYIQNQKMLYAEQSLKDNTVTDVAFGVGFESVSAFITQFKKVYHMTPKQYKTLYLS